MTGSPTSTQPTPLVRKPLGRRSVQQVARWSTRRSLSLPEFVPHSDTLATLPTGAVVRSEDTAPRGADGVPSELWGPIQLSCLGSASPPPHTIITGQELSEPSACYQLHRDWCKADPRSLRGLLVSSFSAWQRMSSCPNHEQPAYRVCQFVGPSFPLPACRCVFRCLRSP